LHLILTGKMHRSPTESKTDLLEELNGNQHSNRAAILFVLISQRVF